MTFDTENWLCKSNCGTFDTFPQYQFSKFNAFLWVCWFLDKNLSNYVFPAWNLDNPYHHIGYYALVFNLKLAAKQWYFVLKLLLGCLRSNTLDQLKYMRCRFETPCYLALHITRLSHWYFVWYLSITIMRELSRFEFQIAHSN